MRGCYLADRAGCGRRVPPGCDRATSSTEGLPRCLETCGREDGTVRRPAITLASRRSLTPPHCKECRRSKNSGLSSDETNVSSRNRRRLLGIWFRRGGPFEYGAVLIGKPSLGIRDAATGSATEARVMFARLANPCASFMHLFAHLLEAGADKLGHRTGRRQGHSQ